MTDDLYGTRHDYLPQSILDAAEDPTSGVVMLSHEASRVIEAESLNRFELWSTHKLSWEFAGARHAVCDNAEDGARQVIDILRNFGTMGESVVVFANNLLIPTVQMSFAFIIDHLAEIFDEFSDFWLYDQSIDVLIDCRTDGDIFYGHPPAAS